MAVNSRMGLEGSVTPRLSGLVPGGRVVGVGLRAPLHRLLSFECLLVFQLLSHFLKCLLDIYKFRRGNLISVGLGRIRVLVLCC